MFVKVLFHGMLKKICPDVYEVDVNTPAEAIRAVTNQFRDKLIRRDGQRFVCSIKECPRDVDLNSCLRENEINIYPSFCASGGGKGASPWAMVAIGALIVVAAVFLGPGGFAAAMTAANWGAWSAGFALMGASMMVSGLTTALFGPNMDTAHSSNNPESSKAFGNSGNTTKIGTRIPIGYGRYKIAGHFLSINTNAVVTKGGDVQKTIRAGFGNKKVTYGTPSMGVE